jgi:hypothetical protein
MIVKLLLVAACLMPVTSQANELDLFKVKKLTKKQCDKQGGEYLGKNKCRILRYPIDR